MCIKEKLVEIKKELLQIIETSNDKEEVWFLNNLIDKINKFI